MLVCNIMKMRTEQYINKLIVFIVMIRVTTFASEESLPHHRVRRFVFAKNSKVSFDIEIQLPVPSLGGVDVEIDIALPLSITLLNDTIVFNPITLKPIQVVIPEVPPVHLNYPSYMPNHYYGYDTYYGSGNSPYFPYHSMKRSIGAASAQHRYDLFSSIAESLEKYGIDGYNCINKAICELANMPMLIESPFHEILEHILTVSRAYDEESLLYEYMEAEKFGKSGGNCTQKYTSCYFSIFNRNDE